MKKGILAMVAGLCSTLSMGLTVTPDSNGLFTVTGPAATFTTWATGTAGGTIEGPGGFSTFENNGWTQSGSAINSDGTLIIPFEFSKPILQATISYNTQVYGYGSNWGRCIIFVTVNGVDTKVYQHDSPDYGSSAVYYNYNGAAPTGAGTFSTSSDITNLVKGTTSFSVRFYSAMGWSGFPYNGGVFMSTAVPSPDFKLTGTVDTVTPLPPTTTVDTVNVGGANAFKYQWNTEEGGNPWVTPNAINEGMDYWNETSGPAYLYLTSNEVGSITWHFWLPDGQTFKNDIVVKGGGSHLSSGEGSWWEGRWSTDGATWHRFYYHSGNYFFDDTTAFALADYGYPGGGRNLYINWQGQKTAGDWVSAQLFRGGLFEVRGSINGTPAPAPVYTLDAQGRWLKDGNPFIPLVMYLVNDMKLTADAGFNTGLTGGDDPNSISSNIPGLDNAYVHEIGVWFHLCNLFRNHADYDGLRAIVNALKSHPALEAWYLADEPSNEPISPSVLAAAAEIIHELDPNHPVIGLDNQPNNFANYAPVFDGFLSDPYPFVNDPGQDINIVTNWIDGSRSVLRSGESLMVCLQAFGQPWAVRGPTGDEIWNMAYQGVTAGVRGIGWWAQGPARDSGNWPEYQQLAGALKTLMPYTVFSNTRQTYSGSGIYAAVFQGTIDTVLVAVNTGSSPAVLTVPVNPPSLTSIGPLRNASATATGGSIQLNIAALGCGAWKLSALAPTPTPTPTPTVIPGDANHDNKVNVSDLGILATNYGMTSGATWEQGDFNNDQKVNVSDLGILATNYGYGMGRAMNFAQDAKAVGLLTGDDVVTTPTESPDLQGPPENTQKTESQTEKNPVGKSLGGCGSAGLPLIAGLLLAGLLLVRVKE